MSRIGKLPIKVPNNVCVKIHNEIIEIKGPIATLTQNIPADIFVEFINDNIKIHKVEDSKLARQKYGLFRSLIENMVLGVCKKFEKKLQMIGVGYKAQVQSSQLVLNVGFTHQVIFKIAEGMEVIVEGNTILIIKGPNKETVGLLAAKIRATRPPEPYKGKGIKYSDEVILRKAGKSGKK